MGTPLYDQYITSKLFELLSDREFPTAKCSVDPTSLPYVLGREVAAFGRVHGQTQNCWLEVGIRANHRSWDKDLEFDEVRLRWFIIQKRFPCVRKWFRLMGHWFLHKRETNTHTQLYNLFRAKEDRRRQSLLPSRTGLSISLSLSLCKLHSSVQMCHCSHSPVLGTGVSDCSSRRSPNAEAFIIISLSNIMLELQNAQRLGRTGGLVERCKTFQKLHAFLLLRIGDKWQAACPYESTSLCKTRTISWNQRHTF